MEVIFWIIIYLVQMAMASFINAEIGTRLPKNGWDFIKLTFLPWLLLLNINKVRRR